ncbi:hypothetical protein E4U55_002561 [Claviceps digitariae]|nr:hypothetical protein E4U55_002561 [Claviceps digitariae]
MKLLASLAAALLANDVSAAHKPAYNPDNDASIPRKPTDRSGNSVIMYHCVLPNNDPIMLLSFFDPDGNRHAADCPQGATVSAEEMDSDGCRNCTISDGFPQPVQVKSCFSPATRRCDIAFWWKGYSFETWSNREAKCGHEGYESEKHLDFAQQALCYFDF